MTIPQESKLCRVFRRQKLKCIYTLRMLWDIENEVAVRPAFANFSCHTERSVISAFFYYLSGYKGFYRFLLISVQYLNISSMSSNHLFKKVLLLCGRDIMWRGCIVLDKIYWETKNFWSTFYCLPIIKISWRPSLFVYKTDNNISHV